MQNWTTRDEYYLRAAIDKAAYLREQLDADISASPMHANPRATSQIRELIARADKNLAALLARKEAKMRRAA